MMLFSDRVISISAETSCLERVAVVVVSLGHTVIARELNVDEVGQVTREERPDVALVGLGESSEHALEHISQIVREAACPVIALLGTDDAAFVSEAAKRGVFGYITDGDGAQLQGAIVREAACPVIALLGTDDAAFVSEAAKRGVFGYITDGDGAQLQGAIDTLSRFEEYHNLEGAFGRRAMIERAKGILMERHAVSDRTAFEMLRDHSQHTGRKLFDIAHAVLDSHVLLSSV